MLMRVVPCAPLAARAGEGNRTPITSLEGWGSTVELHPHGSRRGPASFAVGARGFEPPTPCSQSRCATRLRHAPPRPGMSITKGNSSSKYGRRGYCLYLLVQEAASEGSELFRVCAAHKSGSAFVIYVAWAAEAVPAREDAANLQGGLACGGDQTHLRTQDAVDRRGDERVVGAPEHDRVDPALHNRLEIATRDSFELGSVYDAAFDHGHELGAGLLVDLDSCVQGVDGSHVRAASRGQRRRENSDAPVARLLYRGPRPRLDDPYDRHLERTLCRPQGRGRRCVARDHDQLHVHAYKVVYNLESKPTDLGKVTYPVRHPRGVSEVYGVLVGQTVLDLCKHRQPAHARIENAYGPRIAHGALLCQHATPFACQHVSFSRSGLARRRTRGSC